jgi:hypothetical protein
VYWISKDMGVVGERLVRELRGVSCLPVEDCPPAEAGNHRFAVVWASGYVPSRDAASRRYLYGKSGRKGWL